MIGFINNNKRQKRFRTERDRYKQRSRPVPLKSAEQSLLECCAGTYLSLTRQEGEHFQLPVYVMYNSIKAEM